jgi:hypothetical protein
MPGFVIVFLMVIVVVGNPLLYSVYKSGFSATSSSSTDLLGGSSSIGSQQFSTVPTSIPEVLGKATLLGRVSPDTRLSLQFVLPLRDSVGLQSFLSGAYSPASPFYHHFLSLSQFYAFYAPDPSEVAALTAYMQSNGLQVQASPANPNMAEASGTVSQIQNALKTQIDSFSWNGRVFYSATSQAQLPRQFSNIQMIYGLENLSQASVMGANPLYRILGTITPSQSDLSVPLFYSPSEICQMYNVTGLLNAGYTGTGISIAIVDAYGDPYIKQELREFSTFLRLPFYNGTLHIIPVGSYNATNGITTGWNIEVALDVEWAHAMAPNATINLYVANDSGAHLCEAVYDATLGYNGTANGVYHNNIISMSWGTPENDIGMSTSVDPVYGPNYPWLDQVFQMDAALGITAFASSGDDGAYEQAAGQTSPYGAASYPATDPYVTGVGGTSLYMNTISGYYQWPYMNATGTYGNETAWSWNIDFWCGTGGGWSTFFGQPSWQTGPGVINNGQRGNPDVAWDADPETGVVVSVFNKANGFYYYYIIGGTSVGSPCWAGSMALIDQKAGSSLGFINPTVYSILNNPAEYSKAFHDITVGNDNPDSATRGWDPLTGVGSPNVGELANYLSPTGQLSVVVTNDLSNALGKAYAYGKPVHLTAIVAQNKKISGPVTATFTSSTGGAIASKIVMTYNASESAWLGSYMIKPTDPPGEWFVTVTAVNGSSSGEGFTSFAVGDGVNIMNPPFTTGIVFYQVGNTINIDSCVVDTSGNNVTKGTYKATFYLAQAQNTGNGLGKVEGNVTLQYNPSDRLWEGNFWITGHPAWMPLSNADQGAWIMVVNGTDSAGNKGSAYSWIDVGLYVWPSTYLPTYVLGDSISIWALVYTGNQQELVETGTFSAEVYDGTIFVAKVPLTYNGGSWNGELATSADDPTGFYTITVNGTDGQGNYGSQATVVRMAQYSLNVQATLSNSLVAVQNGNESWLLAKITYPDGSLMSVGQVMGYVYKNTSRVNWFPMTYNPRAGGFVGANVFHAVNATMTPMGNYTVYVEAFDASGNYGNTTTSFSVARLYEVSFVKSGLPQGALWSVAFGGQTQSSTLSSITFNSANGTYPFSIAVPAGYAASPSSGNITVNGANVTEQITFIAASLRVSGNGIVEGESVYVNVTLTNSGNYTETFNVTLYGEFHWGWLNYTFPVYLFTEMTLTPGSTITLNDTVSLTAGVYTLKVCVWRVPSETPISGSANSDAMVLVFPAANRVAWLQGLKLLAKAF